ncbi:hypothetical protein SDC9_172204 [bioreactor metagenome]|uniref:Uncharacterized protein n=1 Tax=bioreactor metagenome TaxID=1076179 RepID=A0A645GFJ2_9ZZZZ
MIYNCDSEVIQQCVGKNSGVTVLCTENGQIFVVSSGTVIKWETALRKAIELIAREKGLSSNGKPEICLQLASLAAVLTEAEKCFISTALNFLNVKAYFCCD